MKKKMSGDVALLASLATALRAEYESRITAWNGSPFEWIRAKPSRQVGKIGEQLVAGWCAARELDVSRSPDSEADKIIEGKRVEIKFSTLWAGGFYTFQQVRDQRYDVLICLGVSPFDAHAWILNKKDIPFSALDHQHGGAKGRDTWWIRVDPKKVPAWMRKYGGTLRDIERFFRKSPPRRVVRSPER